MMFAKKNSSILAAGSWSAIISPMEPIRRKVAAFFKAFPLKQYEKGQILIHADDNPSGVFFIESGEVRQYTITNSGNEVVVNVFKPPAFFPMSWAINRTPNEYFFETASRTSVRTAPADKVVEFVSENPDVLLDLLSRVYRGTDVLLQRMTHLMKGNARSRTILELVIACRYFGKPKDDGSFVVEIPESELAARAGLSRETVSRELHKLHKKGWLEISQKHIIIRSPNALEQELGSGI